MDVPPLVTLHRQSDQPDDCPHEKAARQNEEAQLGADVPMTDVLRAIAKITIALCCSSGNQVLSQAMMCFQPNKSRAYFLWCVATAALGLLCWVLSLQRAYTYEMQDKWSLGIHVFSPLLWLCIGLFGICNISEEEMQDEEWAQSGRANCDRMMWRRALLLLAMLGLLGTAFVASNGIWFYSPDPDVEFLHHHKHPHDVLPSPSPATHSKDTGTGDLIPSWLKSPSPTRIPVPSPTPSPDPAIIVRLEQTERAGRASIGMLFIFSMSFFCCALWFNWRRQTTPRQDDITE